ncbi:MULTISPECIES: sugar phosphate nucleotidyltransferase [Bacillaceae]|uniref:sugar phosphate nucleotidyltransferase n=1 Tax=Bacillaceae TaxID=186817 RepID=UPI000BA76A6C|nr:MULTISPECIES: sugar phosphate nucleotidyltransferase [Bacillaceae]PAE26341.1 spore coat protein [Bacillus sp. 7894-2]URM31145.1 NTP transferase domain-containing protein [Cytobacillus firmus]
MKGIILAGGTGTRLLPFTKILNKHLLPVGPYPMVYWPIIKLRDAGIKDILIITNEKHLSLFKEMLGDGREFNIKLKFQSQQNEGGGIADALLASRDFINKEKFVVVLGDNLFEDSLTPHIKAYVNQKKGARVLLKEVSNPTRYGVPKLDLHEKKILSIHEKPSSPPSSYCVTGIYMYDEEVFKLIKSIKPSERNELEITDVNNLYIQKNQLEYDILNGWWMDAGTHHSLFLAQKYIYENMKEEDHHG